MPKITKKAASLRTRQNGQKMRYTKKMVSSGKWNVPYELGCSSCNGETAIFWANNLARAYNLARAVWGEMAGVHNTPLTYKPEVWLKKLGYL